MALANKTDLPKPPVVSGLFDVTVSPNGKPLIYSEPTAETATDFHLPKSSADRLTAVIEHPGHFSFAEVSRLVKFIEGEIKSPLTGAIRNQYAEIRDMIDGRGLENVYQLVVSRLLGDPKIVAQVYLEHRFHRCCRDMTLSPEILDKLIKSENVCGIERDGLQTVLVVPKNRTITLPGEVLNGNRVYLSSVSPIAGQSDSFDRETGVLVTNQRNSDKFALAGKNTPVYVKGSSPLLARAVPEREVELKILGDSEKNPWVRTVIGVRSDRQEDGSRGARISVKAGPSLLMTIVSVNPSPAPAANQEDRSN